MKSSGRLGYLGLPGETDDLISVDIARKPQNRPWQSSSTARLGLPADYACGKAALFDNEGGGAIIEVDVPDPIIQLAVDENFPLEQGLIQFNKGKGLEELLAAWRALSKRIRLVDCP